MQLPIVVACASLLAFSTGVGEELLFRGFIQQVSPQRERGVMASLSCSSSPLNNTLLKPSRGPILPLGSSLFWAKQRRLIISIQHNFLSLSPSSSLWSQGLINNIGTWPGLLIASALFGLAHSLVPSDLGFLVLFGAYCGISYVLSGNNVVVPIATHTVYDALVLLAAYYRGLGHMTDPRQKHLVPRDEEE